LNLPRNLHKKNRPQFPGTVQRAKRIRPS
jgi:hypothetical protein